MVRIGGSSVSDERGVALVCALMITAMLAALGSALVLVVTAESLVGMNHRTSQQSLYAADAGLERAIGELRRLSTWQLVPGWSSATGMDTSVPSVGDVYEYQLNASLNNGTPMTTPIDSALLFQDDLLNAGILVKRAHFSELRSAVNLYRAQAGLPAFEFDASYNESIVRASHLGGLRTALTQARQTLGMSIPAFTGGGIGTVIQASHVQELRELAR